jgi:hypothetical protein
MEQLREYGVACHVYVPIIKRAVVDFAVGADWTPAAGDVKISKDGGAAANVTNLPTAITMGNTAMWDFSLTATEMQAAQVNVTVADAATKAVEDQMFLISTYGNASARHKVNLNDSVRAGLTALPNAAAEAAGGLYTRGAGAGQINQQTNGQVDTNVARWLNTAAATPATAGVPKVAIEAAGDFAQGAADKVWSTAARALTDKVGFALSAAGIQAIWDALTSALTTVGSIGKRLADDIDATISSRSTYAGGDTAGTTTLLGRLTAGRATNLDNLDATVSSRSTYAGADTAGTTTLLTRVLGVVPVAADYTAARATKLDNLDVAVSSRGTSTLTTADTIGADVKKINGTTVTGNGTSGTPWGP